MSEPKIQYGFYSKKCSERNGTFTYKTTDGREVEVSAVMSDREGSAMGWDDTVFVAEVLDVRSGGFVRRSLLAQEGRRL